MFRGAFILAAALVLLSGTGAFGASGNLAPQTLLSATNNAVSSIGALVGLGADLHAYESVKPYSKLTGVDVGLDATAIVIPGGATNALTVLGIPNIPHYLPVPKLNIQKALTKNLLVGTAFLPNIRVKGNTITSYGGDIQWTAIDRLGMPPIAFRGQFNYSNLVVATAATWGADVLTGWRILFVDIYGGAGYRLVSATISNPTSTVPTLPGVNLDTTADAGHFFAGAAFATGFARLTLEADLTTRGVNTYGTKLSLYF